MRHIFGFLCGILLLSSCAMSEARKDGAARLKDDSELIVMVAGSADHLIARSEALGYVTRSVKPLPEIGDILVSFDIPEGMSIAEAIAQIEEAVPGVTAGAHHLYELQAAPYGLHTASYAHGLIQWPEEGCAPVRRVGLIDAGVPRSHPALATGQIVQADFVQTADVAALDHGVQMASLLIGEGRLTSGVLYSANVVDASEAGGQTAGVSALLEAVNWLASQEVEVVNISMAGPRNKLLNRGMARAAQSGMIFVAAAGNQGAAAAPQYPAAFPFVLAVTAVDQELKIYRHAVQGAQIDVAAPGVDVIVNDPFGSIRVLSGTSAATPFVTAMVAANAAWRDYDVFAVRAALATVTHDIGAPGRDSVFGHGLIQASTMCR